MLVNGEGLWLNSLDYLPVCYTHSILTVVHVVCYQSVTRNSNTISGYVYNRELITLPTPISHSPGKFKFWIWQFCFFSNSCFWWCYQTHFSIICITFNLDACKVSFLYQKFVNVRTFEKRVPDVKHVWNYTKACPSATYRLI